MVRATDATLERATRDRASRRVSGPCLARRPVERRKRVLGARPSPVRASSPEVCSRVYYVPERPPSRKVERKREGFVPRDDQTLAYVHKREKPEPTHARTHALYERALVVFEISPMTYESPRDERFSERRMHFEAFVLHCASVTAEGHTGERS